MTLGQRISQHRKKLGISQEILGERLGVSRQAVSKWETDVASPDMENMLALAREFGVSVAELTQTPEKTPISDSTSVSPTSSHFPSFRRLFLLVICALLSLILVGALVLTFFMNLPFSDPAEQATEEPPTENSSTVQLPSISGNSSDILLSPKTDFALLWYASNGNEEFLELGEQEGFFPFGTTLKLTETAESQDTDFDIMTSHQADCGAINIGYYHIAEDPNLDPESPERESIWCLTTMVSDVRTPRNIHPGSTKAEVLSAYGDALVYCMKEENSYTLINHDYYYAFQTPETFGASLQFFMLDGIVAGIRVEHMAELGNTAFAPNHISRFPLKDGEPDFSLREEPEQEQISDTRKVYIAWNQLVTNNNLSAAEQYAYRRDIFGLLPYMDWGELCALGNTEQPDDTLLGLMSWLSNQDTYSSSEILWIQMGCTAKGIDGAYTEAYGLLLYSAFSYDPISFIKALATDGIDETTKWHAILSTAFNAVWYERECTQIIETLEAALSNGIFNEPQSDWCRLMLLYLRTPEDEMGTLPRSPADMP